jgi:hypothetical protein
VQSDFEKKADALVATARQVLEAGLAELESLAVRKA